MSPHLRTFLPASALAVVLALALPSSPAAAAQPAVGLGTATPFAVLAGTTVTNTGPSVISGSVGVSPGTAVVGFPPAVVGNGTIHAANAVALQAESDLTTAYNDAAGRGPVVDQTDKELGGQTLTPGVYSAATSMGLTGTLTLDAKGDPAAVFIFQAGSTLLTAKSSRVLLIGSAQPCNVFWQVGSSATIGPATMFVGTVMALTSITLQTGATVQGRMLARNGQVSLDTNTITQPACATAPDVTPSPTPTPSTTPSDSSEDETPSADTTASSSSGGGGGNAGGGDGSNGGGGNGITGGGPSGGPPAGGPFIPTGHPETGRPTDDRSPSPAWLGLGVVCLVGAGAAARRSQRTVSAAQHRR